MSLMALFLIGCFLLLVFSWGWTTHRLRQHGIPAEATILQMERTLMQINRRHVYDFLLEVNLPGRPAYQVRHKSRALDWNAFIVEPGVRFKVKVDPGDPQRLVVLEPVTPQQRPLRIHELLSGLERPSDPVKALKDLQSMLDNGLITPDEYAQKKAEILARL
ncbi:SHOCT domain-containing protein [Archangium lansingense]|uniref:SHOCT domain-containing protein n=2 Tax=Archangium lansingense TaxID=2995310 RepID=A0ABT4A258_9BACT|nr:SHOCT domain-containing protein [Archangium lansinium]MCY1075698.1 SHOCT domain-containing protein [Archangium lansinium]